MPELIPFVYFVCLVGRIDSERLFGESSFSAKINLNFERPHKIRLCQARSCQPISAALFLPTDSSAGFKTVNQSTFLVRYITKARVTNSPMLPSSRA